MSVVSPKSKIRVTINDDVFDFNETTVNMVGIEIGESVKSCSSIDNQVNQFYLKIDAAGRGVAVESSAEATSTSLGSKVSIWPSWSRHFKLAILLICWMLCCGVLMIRTERVQVTHQVSVPSFKHSRAHFIPEYPYKNEVRVMLEGAILPPYYGNLSKHWISIWIELVGLRYVPKNISDIKADDIIFVKNITEVWRVPTVSQELIGFVPEISRSNMFELLDINETMRDNYRLRLKFRTNLKSMFPISLIYNLTPIREEDGIIYAALVLFALYLLIIFELVHRTLAAMLASTMSVAILAALNERPSMQEIISWIDVETLLLLFSMMTLVGIFSETGIFDYMAVLAYKITNGQIWPLINTLCFFTAFLSSFLDNVTTVLLMTPVTIRLCEVMELNPVPILMTMVIYSNIGGAMTPVGDPPNVIIASNTEIIKAGVNFSTFFIHMGIGVILSAFVVYIQLRWKFSNIKKLKFKEPQEVQDLRHEIAILRRTAASLSSYSKEEDAVKDSLAKKSSWLMSRLKNKMYSTDISVDNYKTTLEELQAKYPIRDPTLLIKSLFTLVFVISVFFLHSVPDFGRLGLGWTALLGVLLLLLLADRDDIEAVLARVEWSTLLFFASLFILMEALSKLGLIDWIGRRTHTLILCAPHGPARLGVAILLILWVSAAASAFVDNIPLTTMMVRVAVSLSDDQELELPLQPLVWALSFGACLGGNGTLFGSSANVICAGVAEQHGYRFTFIEFFKVGFPIMLSSMVVITFYLLIAHVVLGWNF